MKKKEDQTLSSLWNTGHAGITTSVAQSWAAEVFTRLKGHTVVIGPIRTGKSKVVGENYEAFRLSEAEAQKIKLSN